MSSVIFKNARLLAEYGFGNDDVFVGVRDSKIEYVGIEQPSAKYETTVDCEYNLLIPAFYNAHCHCPMTLFRGYAEGLRLGDWLNKIFAAEDRLNNENVYWGTVLSIAEMLAGGIASFSDMYMFEDIIGKAVLETGIKANLARGLVSFEDDAGIKEDKRFKEAQELIAKYNGAGDGRIITDISIHAEYTNKPKYCREVAGYAAENGLQMQMHISETEDEHLKCIEKYGKTPVEFFESVGAFDIPTSAAHCVWINDKDIDVLKSRNVSVVHNPVSNLKLGSGIMKLSKLLSSGINVALGTDGAASNNTLDIIKEMQYAALLSNSVSGESNIVTAADVFHAATVNGALAQGRKDCGRIECGMRADIVLLNLKSFNNIPFFDGYSTMAYSAKSSDVLITMVDGRILFNRGEYTSIDTERLRYEFKRVSEHYFE